MIQSSEDGIRVLILSLLMDRLCPTLPHSDTIAARSPGPGCRVVAVWFWFNTEPVIQTSQKNQATGEENITLLEYVGVLLRGTHVRPWTRRSSDLRIGAQSWQGPFLAPARCATDLLHQLTVHHHHQNPLPSSTAVRSLSSALRASSARSNAALHLRCTLPALFLLRLIGDDAVAEAPLSRRLRAVPTPPHFSRRVGLPPLTFRFLRVPARHPRSCFYGGSAPRPSHSSSGRAHQAHSSFDAAHVRSGSSGAPYPHHRT
ncbi:hypothetical protein CRENBAI_021139 [Crenichthys baileyi]|uniref:Secreted protein n=1 Tax=Crenichthys baileyi TaxID=28760 RepID=A0AAV9RCY8_9TELE